MIDRNGEEVRYVIDFYKGTNTAGGPGGHHGAPISMHLDVRPALDSVGALIDRVNYSLRETFRPESLPKVEHKPHNLVLQPVQQATAADTHSKK